MKIPREILDVERPKNTVVCDSKVDSPNRYFVRSRVGCVYVKGHNPRPLNGPVIGHIIEGKFVPVAPKAGSNGEDLKSYGSSKLVYEVSHDILDDLMKVYALSDCYSIIAAASLKVIKPHIASNRMDTHYHLSFISEFYPGASLSKNSMTSLYQRLGMDQEKRLAFFRLRMERVIATHHIIIDSTLKQDTSTENDLSAFSYKARLKGCEDISIVYSYDLELKEPITCAVFPGNCVDSVAYNKFLEESNITSGLVIDDKGFPPSIIKKYKQEHPDYSNLYYLTPIKRNDKRIKKYNMLDFDDVVTNIKENVVCKKVKVSDTTFLYSFRDPYLEYKEKKSYIEHSKKNKSFTVTKFSSKQDVFGIIVFESNLDLTCSQAYKAYQSRWELEIVFKYYKSAIGLNTTNVQGDFAVIGEEFVNFLATLITCRIVNKASAVGLLEKMTYGNLMDDLSTAWRSTNYSGKPSDKPKSNGRGWVHTIPKVMKEMELLDLVIPEVVERKKNEKTKKEAKDKPESDITKTPKKRGRPRKIKEETQSEQSTGNSTKEDENKTKSDATKSSKKRGRPRKVKEETQSEQSEQSTENSTKEDDSNTKSNVTKSSKKRGRPKKVKEETQSEQSTENSIKDDDSKTKSDVTKTPKKRGRPRKVKEETQSEQSAENSIKEDDSNTKSDVTKTPKKRGRPRKVKEETQSEQSAENSIKEDDSNTVNNL